MNLYLLLFADFFKIALLTIGGGLAMIPVIEGVFIKKRALLTQDDMINMVGITQTIPGLIAINCAVFVGYKLAGWRGSFVAVLGVILPSMIIVTAIAVLFPPEKLSAEIMLEAFGCVRACVLGLFVVLAWKIGKTLLKSGKDIFFLLLLCGLFQVDLYLPLSVVFACILSGVYEIYLRVESTESKK